ncbi:MAG: hypothetical protein HY741_12705 [Chloroflexi bacterium]|nr:hypothetical protein [Chloroflexota bacterium]
MQSDPGSGQSAKSVAQTDEIVAAAQAVGVEINANETAQWLIAMSASEKDALAQDAQHGIFGHRIALLDFDADDLAYFRRLAQRVRVVSHPQVESAIAIAGSAAQGKVQLFPGDNDFFERVNIRADRIEKARKILRAVMRATALRALHEPDIVLVEVNFGVYPREVLERGSKRAAGDSITWTPQDVVNGFIEVQTTDGAPLKIQWDETSAGMGWTYLGWIVADRTAGRIALASNMLDVTWQAPDSAITALDGSIDPFFQEIYLEPNALPIFAKITRAADKGALNAYANAMRAQVFHYTHEEPNYGKASKRLYNLFRLTDQLEAAAYLREIFDEPQAQLYQVPGLLEAANVALCDPSAEIDRATVLQQIEVVMQHVRDATEGQDEARILTELSRLKSDVLREPPGADWEQILQDVRERCAAIVNEFFRARLFGFAAIEEYVEGLKAIS